MTPLIFHDCSTGARIIEYRWWRWVAKILVVFLLFTVGCVVTL